MQKRKGLVAVFLFILPLFSAAQTKTEETISWEPDVKLRWADFRARPEKNGDAAASTTTFLGIEYNITSKGFTYAISCTFSKNRSWVLHKTDYILLHEQGHFDIAEIFARRLNKAMQEYTFNQKTFEKDLARIYNHIVEEKEFFQNSYDAETNHSINKQKQAEWLTRIALLLEESQDYAGY